MPQAGRDLPVRRPPVCRLHCPDQPGGAARGDRRLRRRVDVRRRVPDGCPRKPGAGEAREDRLPRWRRWRRRRRRRRCTPHPRPVGHADLRWYRSVRFYSLNLYRELILIYVME